MISTFILATALQIQGLNFQDLTPFNPRFLHEKDPVVRKAIEALWRTPSPQLLNEKAYYGKHDEPGGYVSRVAGGVTEYERSVIYETAFLISTLKYGQLRSIANRLSIKEGARSMNWIGFKESELRLGYILALLEVLPQNGFYGNSLWGWIEGEGRFSLPAPSAWNARMWGPYPAPFFMFEHIHKGSSWRQFSGYDSQGLIVDAKNPIRKLQ